MSDERFLQSLGLIIIAGAIFALLARRLRLPTIVAYLTAGLVLGPLTGVLTAPEALAVISEAGIVLLLFLVGLELSIEKIRAVGRSAAIAGTAQIVITMIAGFGIGRAMGFAPLAAGVLAVGLTLSSTVVVVKCLVEQKATASVSGQTAIGILLVQDLFVIILLTVLSGLGDAQQLDLATVARGAGKALASMSLFLVATIIAARFVIPRPFDWARRSRETVFIASLTWCFTVVLAVHALHLSAEIGAFLAGISLAQLPHAHDLQRRVTPLMNCFVAVFFVTLSATVVFPTELVFWIEALVLSIFVIFGKFIIIAAITRRLGYKPRQAFNTSLRLVQISEFSFIFAAAAAGAGLVDEEMRTLLAVVGIITITVSSALSLFSPRLFALYFASPLCRKHREASDPAATETNTPPRKLSDHVIIVGMNTLGRELVNRLCQRGTTVLAIDTDPAKLVNLPCHALEGEASSPAVLEEAGLERARLLVTTLHINDMNELLAYRARAAGVPCAAHVPEIRRTANLLALDVAYLMTPKADSLRVQRATLKELGLLGRK